MPTGPILWDLGDDPYGNVFGDTSTGRHLMVVYEEMGADTVYPMTAYDVPRRRRR